LQGSHSIKNRKEKKSIDFVAAFVVPFLVEEYLSVVFLVSSRLSLSSGEAGAGTPHFYTFRKNFLPPTFSTTVT